MFRFFHAGDIDINLLFRANVGLYEPRGDYQIIVEHLEFDGAGLLKQQYEQLKNTLQAEGLFATQTKQAIPQDIKTVGIITSATGAALHDITTVLKRRNPMINVIVYPLRFKVLQLLLKSSMLFLLPIVVVKWMYS